MSDASPFIATPSALFLYREKSEKPVRWLRKMRCDLENNFCFALPHAGSRPSTAGTGPAGPAQNQVNFMPNAGMRVDF
jgi:hypothetical protein